MGVWVCVPNANYTFCISPSLVLPHQFLLLPFFVVFFKLSARGFNVACAPSALCEPNELKRAIQSYKIEHIEQESGQAGGFTKCVCVLYAQTSDRCQRTKLTTKEKSNKRSFRPNACPSVNPSWPTLFSSLLAANSTTHSLLLLPSSPFIITSFLSSLSSLSSFVFLQLLPLPFQSFVSFVFPCVLDCCLCVSPLEHSLDSTPPFPSFSYPIPRSSSIYTSFYPLNSVLSISSTTLSRWSFVITQHPLTSLISSLRYHCPYTSNTPPSIALHLLFSALP